MRIFDRAGREIETAGLINEQGQPLSGLGSAGLGAVGSHDPDLGEYAERFRGWVKVLSQDPLNLILGPKVNDTISGSVTLRPERIILKRISWACDGEQQNPYNGIPAAPNVNGWDPVVMNSIQGRCVEMEWFDEFTKFMSDRKALVVALLGEPGLNGVGLPKPILLQGKQTISIRLNRIRWPFPIGPIDDKNWPDPFPVRFDFVFHSIMLLPPGTHESGSAPVKSE